MSAGKRLTNQEFIERSNSIHGDKYDYSLVSYTNISTLVTIICPYHGQFQKTPNKHLIGQGCPKCALKRRVRFRTYTKVEFISLAHQVHGNKYDYSLSDYKTSQSPISIICPSHGEFRQRPAAHIFGQGCMKCYKEQFNNDRFIRQAQLIHGEKYNYSKIKYVTSREKVEIICHVHGSFWQRASAHLFGQGCPICKLSSGEQRMEIVLTQLNIKFYKQQQFAACYLRYPLPFDFYFQFNGYHFLIEYDGEQHFMPIKFYGGIHDYELRKQRDSIKTQFAQDNGFILIRIPYTEFDNIEAILKAEIEKYS